MPQSDLHQHWCLKEKAKALLICFHWQFDVSDWPWRRSWILVTSQLCASPPFLVRTSFRPLCLSFLCTSRLYSQLYQHLCMFLLVWLFQLFFGCCCWHCNDDLCHCVYNLALLFVAEQEVLSVRCFVWTLQAIRKFLGHLHMVVCSLIIVILYILLCHNR